MVVGDFGAVAYLGGQNGVRHSHPADLRRRSRQSRNRPFHIGGQIPAVGAGIGAELLFIQCLEIVQGLLGRVAKLPVGIPLEGCQVIEGRRLFRFFFLLHSLDQGGLVFTDIRHRLGRRFLGAFLTGGRKSAAVQNRRIKRNRLEGADLGLPLDDQGQRWGHHTPDVQSAVVQHAEKPGGIDPHQPVGFGPAQGGRIQPVIVAARLEGRKALPDSGILHAGNPQPEHGLLAAGQVVDGAEDGLSLAPGIAGVHHLGHIGPLHQFFQQVKLFFLIGGHRILPFLRQDRQVLIAPLGIVRVIGGGIRKLRQVAETPAHQIPAAFQIAVLSVYGPQHRGNALCNGGFLCNHKSAHGFTLLSLGFIAACSVTPR